MRGALIALLLAVCAPALAAEGDRSDLSSETVLDVTVPKTIADRAQRFEEHLRKLGFAGKIVSCQGMVDLPAGVEGGDHSYGAVCTLEAGGHQSEAMLCDDNIFGHFAMRADKFVNTREAVAMFTDENCSGD
jgi:hypothetical protein